MLQLTWMALALPGVAAQPAPVRPEAAALVQQHSRHVVYDEEPLIVWLAPRTTTAVDPARWVMVAQGAVVALELASIPQAQVANPAAIDLPERLGSDIPAGTRFARRMRNWSGDACLMRPGRSASEAFVDLCLADTNGDGLHDVAARGGETADIEPVRLDPAAADLDATTRVQRRLVVSAVRSNRIELSIEYSVRGGGNYCSVRTGAAPGGKRRSWVLILDRNAAAVVDGLRIEARKSRAGRWWINARGAFHSWASLGRSATVIDVEGITSTCIR